MRRCRLLRQVLAALAVTAAVHVFGTSPVGAQEVEGSYTLVAEQSDDIPRVIEKGTSRLNFLVRRIARSRLKKTNQPYLTAVIHRTGGQVSIGTDGADPVVTPADGAVIEWTREDGETFAVNTVESQGGIRQTFTAEDGSRENLWLPMAGDGLELQVTISSGKLPEPIRYRMVYRRN
jgi:hypothetical protein